MNDDITYLEQDDKRFSSIGCGEIITGPHTVVRIQITNAKFLGQSETVRLLSIRKFRRSKWQGGFYPVKGSGISINMAHKDKLIKLLQGIQDPEVV